MLTLGSSEVIDQITMTTEKPDVATTVASKDT